LILIPVARNGDEGNWICSYCQYPLRYVYLNSEHDIYWCPRCKKWRWMGWTIRWITQKRKLLKEDDGSKILKGSLTIMNRRLDKCLIKIKERMDMTVKIYSAEEYSQEFLKNLIEED
jgi:hypothetical protein